jgi:AraC-like DNA-binding protein
MGHVGLLYVVRGYVEVSEGRSTRRLSAGQAFVRPPGPRVEVRTPVKPTVLRRFATIAGPVVDALLGCSGLDKPVVLTPSDPKRMARLMKSATAASCASNYEGLHQSCSLAFNILMELKRALPRNRLPASLSRAMELVEARLPGRLTTHDLCDAAGVCSSRLHLLFRGHLGLAPMQYFSRRKMEHAAAKLLDPELSIKEVAYRMGYDDPAYFTRTFVSAMGVPPSEYRRRHAWEEP